MCALGSIRLKRGWFYVYVFECHDSFCISSFYIYTVFISFGSIFYLVLHHNSIFYCLRVREYSIHFLQQRFAFVFTVTFHFFMCISCWIQLNLYTKCDIHPLYRSVSPSSFLCIAFAHVLTVSPSVSRWLLLSDLPTYGLKWRWA